MKCRCYSSFKRSNKFMGIIDYKSLFILIIYMLIMFKIINIFNINIEYKVYLYMFFVIPIISICIIYSSNDNVINIFINILKYYLKKGTYVNFD